MPKAERPNSSEETRLAYDRLYEEFHSNATEEYWSKKKQIEDALTRLKAKVLDALGINIQEEIDTILPNGSHLEYSHSEDTPGAWLLAITTKEDRIIIHDPKDAHIYCPRPFISVISHESGDKIGLRSSSRLIFGLEAVKLAEIEVDSMLSNPIVETQEPQ